MKKAGMTRNQHFSLLGSGIEIDDSPLPTSALPYIYSAESVISTSTRSTHSHRTQFNNLATSIFPPLESSGHFDFSTGTSTSKSQSAATTEPGSCTVGYGEINENEPQDAKVSLNASPSTLRARDRDRAHSRLSVPSATETVREAIHSKKEMDRKKSNRNGNRTAAETNSHDPRLNGHDNLTMNNSALHHSHHPSDKSDANATNEYSPGNRHHMNIDIDSYSVYSTAHDHSPTLRRRRKCLIDFSVRVTTSQSRTDPSGKLFTSYIICVETKDGRYNVEHRYSDFSRIYRQLKVNGIILKSPFPNKSWAGRLGDWTPSIAWAPEKNMEMIRTREKMLDVWIVELCQALQDELSPLFEKLHEKEIRELVESFFQRSSTAVPPCDRANNISWDGLLEDDMELVYDGQMKHEGGAQKFLGNPLTFNLTSSIRQAAYTIMQMCGTKTTLTMNGDSSDQSIPLDLLQQAKGLVFLTVAKAGVLVSIRGGTGLMVARRRDGSWTPPVALGTIGVGWGALIGGDITRYLIVLNTERADTSNGYQMAGAVRIFAQNKSVNLGAELGVAVGIGRAATGNLNAGPGVLPAPAYAYAHSKGLFAGISVEGAIVVVRQDVNAKFYGKNIDAQELLFGGAQPRPRAALSLYDALNEAMSLDVPNNGFRPSEVLKHAASIPGKTP